MKEPAARREESATGEKDRKAEAPVTARDGAAPPTEAPATAAPASAAAPTAAAATLVRFEITSKPSKAKVYRLPENELVGETPCKVPSEPGTGKVLFLLRRTGYKDARVEIDAATGGKAAAVLDKVKGHDEPIKPVRDEGIAPAR